uniref:NADP-dependent oxidoreductase domain-containing protein n=1 Tax=Arcella intermedia TaxID=1963864 RepID=A0A6B2LCK2_9EUKA
MTKVVLSALRAGFAHLDLAEMYGNEREVGAALREWLDDQHPRESLWITSKVWKSFKDIEHQCRATIARLGCTYLDLYLIHAPPRLHPSGLPILQVWQGMERLVRLGLAKRIGISNFAVEDIEELFESGEVTFPPFLHQFKFDPRHQQEEVRACSLRHGMVLAAHGTLGPLKSDSEGPLHGVLRGLAGKYGVSTAAVLHRYAQQSGFVVITTTRNTTRLHPYLATFHQPPPFTLTAQEMSTISLEGKKASPGEEKE